MTKSVEEIEQKIKELQRKKREATKKEKDRKMKEELEELRALKVEIETLGGLKEVKTKLSNYNAIMEQAKVLGFDVKSFYEMLQQEVSKKSQ